jgi:putative transposase
MPWKETCAMRERANFVLIFRGGSMSMAALCRAFGISRQTGYKWLRRYEERGDLGDLENRSRRPHGHPRTTGPSLVNRIVAERRAHPRWGPRKIRVVLRKKFPGLRWPAVSTVGDILKREGLVAARIRRRRVEPSTQPFAECRAPNDLWTVDFKGQFRTSDGAWCYPLTVMDAHSRYLLACIAFVRPSLGKVRKAFRDLFVRYGLPRTIRSDNGEPFASASAPGALSPLSAWWMRLGIRVERIEPGKPQQNGRHERMHLTLKLEATRPACRSARAQQNALDRFRKQYNYERPHESLRMKTPAELYTRSERRMPKNLPQFDYGPSPTYRVDGGGRVRWRGTRWLFLSQALRGQTVAIDWLDARYLSVSYGAMTLGLFDTEEFNRGLIRKKERRKGIQVSAM